MDVSKQWKCFISIMCGWGNTRRFGAPKFSRSACRCSWWRWTRFLPPRWPTFLSYFFFLFCYLRLSTWHLCVGRRYLKVTADYGAKHPEKSIRPFPFPATNTHTRHKSCHTWLPVPSMMAADQPLYSHVRHTSAHTDTHTLQAYTHVEELFFLSVCEIVHITIPTLI